MIDLIKCTQIKGSPPLSKKDVHCILEAKFAQKKRWPDVAALSDIWKTGFDVIPFWSDVATRLS